MYSYDIFIYGKYKNMVIIFIIEKGKNNNCF